MRTAALVSPALCNYPELFPNSLKIIPGSFQEQAIKSTNVPFYQNGMALLQPDYTWGSRIANTPPSIGYPGFMCWNYTLDSAFSITKIWRTHTIKAGYQGQNSVKVQNLGSQTTGTLPIEGAVDFSNNANNPIDTGFGFSNAALGVFNSFAQQGPNQMEGRLVYHNVDFYIEDNWKVNSKLSLDLGVRFVHNGPQYDSRGQESNFFPNLWQASQAPQLFQPGCAVTVAAGAACPGADAVALNPLTGASLGIGSGPLVGFIVPNSGNALNGIQVAGKGIDKANYTEPFEVPTPRVGMAYSPKGQKFVIRAGVGMMIERPQGDAVFGQLGNPPFAQQMTVYYSTLQQVAAGAVGQYAAPPNLTVFHYDASLPSSLQWNIGAQTLLPWNSSFDASWVGIYNYNTIEYGTVGTTFMQSPMDENAPDLGTAYLAKYQDPTLGTSSIPGATSVNTNLLRPYRGLGSITSSWPYAWNRYDTLQFTFNKQYSHGLTLGGNYVLGLRNVGNMLSPPHFQHNSDGSFEWSPLQSQLDSVIDDSGLRRNTVKAWGVYQIPNLHMGNKALSAFVSRWQVSATAQGGSGVPYDAISLVSLQRRERKHHGLAVLCRAHQDHGRYRRGLLRQSIPGVQPGRIRGTRVWQHRQRVRIVHVARLPRPSDEYGDQPLFPAGQIRNAAVADPRGRLQHIQQYDLQLILDHDGSTQPGCSNNDPEQSIQRRRHLEPVALDSGHGRVRRGHRRYADALDTASGEVLFLNFPSKLSQRGTRSARVPRSGFP